MNSLYGNAHQHVPISPQHARPSPLSNIHHHNLTFNHNLDITGTHDHLLKSSSSTSTDLAAASPSSAAAKRLDASDASRMKVGQQPSSSSGAGAKKAPAIGGAGRRTRGKATGKADSSSNAASASKSSNAASSRRNNAVDQSGEDDDDRDDSQYGDEDDVKGQRFYAGPVASTSATVTPGTGEVPILLAPDYTLNPAGPASSESTDFRCPNCTKVYKGKHARSIWRRHLQDKHGIPLSMQPRRTRWDNGQCRTSREPIILVCSFVWTPHFQMPIDLNLKPRDASGR